MKNPHYELFSRLQKQHHRNKPWRLSHGGFFVPHDYSKMEPDKLTTWDDVGFNLNGRRVIVWFQHPRCKYRDVIEQAIERGRKRLPAGLQFTVEELEEESEILKAFEEGTLERITYAARISQ